MKISTKSWHYKLVCFVCIRPSDNLCGYFREVMAVMLMMTVGAIMAAPCLFVLLTPFLMWVWPYWAQPGCVVGFLITILTAIYLMWKIFKPIARATGTVYDKISEATFVEVTSAWISARKKSICPRIDFE